jgi:Adenylate and Guanylate cyclase catalytic domain
VRRAVRQAPGFRCPRRFGGRVQQPGQAVRRQRGLIQPRRGLGQPVVGIELRQAPGILTGFFLGGHVVVAQAAVLRRAVGAVTGLRPAVLDRVGQLGEDVYAQVLAGHHALIRSVLAAHDGTEMNTMGDGFFAVFSSPRGCVAAVLQMQQALEGHAWPGGERVRVRMGIHCGEAARTETGLVGLEVHRAARVAAVGYGGQVLVSEAAAVLVRDGLPPGAALADLGSHRLKDLGRPEQIFQLRAAGLQAKFPPLRSLGNPALPNNLPAQLSAFIGRQREVAEVRALVESARLVTLTGAGGCGKTRLGLQVAAELLEGSGDGVWLAELAAVTDEDAVPAAICGALRLDVDPGRPALEALLDALALQDVLIVVDNCEHLIGGCAKVAEAIVRHCPRVHLLATSREPLGIGGEIIYRVPSLSLPGPADSAAAAEHVVPCFRYRPYVQVGRDYEGATVMRGPAFAQVSATLLQLYPAWFEAPQGQSRRWFADNLTVCFVDACIAELALRGGDGRGTQ